MFRVSQGTLDKETTNRLGELITALGEHCKLEHLCFSFDIGDHGKRALLKSIENDRFRELRVLDLFDTYINDIIEPFIDGIIHHMPNINHLAILHASLGGSKITEKLAELIKSSPTLEFLVLAGNPIIPDDVKVLVEAISESLGKYNNFRCLNITENKTVYADEIYHYIRSNVDSNATISRAEPFATIYTNNSKALFIFDYYDPNDPDSPMYDPTMGL